MRRTLRRVVVLLVLASSAASAQVQGVIGGVYCYRTSDGRHNYHFLVSCEDGHCDSALANHCQSFHGMSVGYCYASGRMVESEARVYTAGPTIIKSVVYFGGVAMLLEDSRTDGNGNSLPSQAQEWAEMGASLGLAFAMFYNARHGAPRWLTVTTAGAAGALAGHAAATIERKESGVDRVVEKTAVMGGAAVVTVFAFTSLASGSKYRPFGGRVQPIFTPRRIGVRVWH